MGRKSLLIFLTATATAVSGVFILRGPVASAETAAPEIAYEGWYDRFRDEDIQVDPNTNNTNTVCTIVGQTTTAGCGAVSPGDSPSPRSKSTGAYVVASSGGDASDEADGGDTAWAAFQWDLLEYQGATAERFVVHLTLAEDNNNRNNGDTYTGTETLPPIQACNVLEGWGSDPGANAWRTRPPVSTQCIAPTNPNGTPQTTGRTIRFDVTSFAESWLDGSGFGLVIRPGTPASRTNLQPFQLTFSGYYDAPANSSGCSAPVPVNCTTTSPTPPAVTFEFTPAADDEDFGGFEDFGGGGEEFFEDITTGGGTLEPVAGIDVIPTDEGSPPLPEEVAATASGEATAELAAEGSGGRSGLISAEPSFPWAILFLLPLIALAFWGTGTALGPNGDPVPARTGGVSRVLAQRQAAQRGTDLPVRNT